MANKQKQMLAVWGSPGAGKTVTAVKLAAELAKRKKNVVLVFTDLTAPSLPAVAAEGKLPEVSVGELLSAPGMTQERVLKTCVPCEKHPYPGLREGYSGGYQLSGSSWTQNVTTGNVYDRLQQVLGLVYEDGRYLKYAGPDLEYRFYDLHMELENAPLAPSAPAGITQLNVTGTVTVEVPLSFGFGHLPPMQITMKLNAKYVPRF